MLIGEQVQAYFIINTDLVIVKKDLIFFNDISGLISSIIQNINVVREKDLIHKEFGRSVDPLVRDHILSSNKNGERLTVTIMFLDIRNFTTLSEKLGPGETVLFLNNIFENCHKIVKNNGGFINKFTGDGFMAVFGALKANDFHEKDGTIAALEIIKTINTPIGIGITSGEVLAGEIGSDERMEYTVIGDTVNIASRIEGMCKTFNSKLLISDSTFKMIKEHLPCYRNLGKFRLKGKNEPILIYDIINPQGCFTQDFITGITSFYSGNFNFAKEIFTNILEFFPNDYASKWYISKCQEYEYAKDWDGVITLINK